MEQSSEISAAKENQGLLQKTFQLFSEIFDEMKKKDWNQHLNYIPINSDHRPTEKLVDEKTKNLQIYSRYIILTFEATTFIIFVIMLVVLFLAFVKCYSDLKKQNKKLFSIKSSHSDSKGNSPFVKKEKTCSKSYCATSAFESVGRTFLQGSQLDPLPDGPVFLTEAEQKEKELSSKPFRNCVLSNGSTIETKSILKNSTAKAKSNSIAAENELKISPGRQTHDGKNGQPKSILFGGSQNKSRVNFLKNNLCKCVKEYPSVDSIPPNFIHRSDCYKSVENLASPKEKEKESDSVSMTSRSHNWSNFSKV